MAEQDEAPGRCCRAGTSEAAPVQLTKHSPAACAITLCARSPRQNSWPRLQGVGPRVSANKGNFYRCFCWRETEESTCRSLCHGHCAVPSSLSSLSRLSRADNELSPCPGSGCSSLAAGLFLPSLASWIQLSPGASSLTPASLSCPADCGGLVWGAQVDTAKEENISCLVNPVFELELGLGRSLVSLQR